MLLSLIAAIALPRFIEIPSTSPNVTFQAVVKLADLTSREMAGLEVAAEALADGSKDFSRSTLYETSFAAGDRLFCALCPDHLRLSYTVPSALAEEGAEAFASVLAAPRLDDRVLEDLIAKLPFRHRTSWAIALSPWQPDYKLLTPKLVREIYASITVPSATTIGVGGAFKSGITKGVLLPALSNWKPPAPRRLRDPKPSELGKNGSDVETLEITLPTADSPEELIFGAIVLGIGKGATLYEALRERSGLTYRQEAVVAPTPAGLRLRIIMTRTELPAEIASRIVPLLVGQVEQYTEVDHARALGVLKGLSQASFPISPIVLDPIAPLTQSLSDQTYLQTYWWATVGQTFRWEEVSRVSKAASWEAWRDRLRAWVQAGVLRIIRR